MQEGEQLIAAVMRHMLFRQHQKPDQLVRRDELNKIIQNNYKARHAPDIALFIVWLLQIVGLAWRGICAGLEEEEQHLLVASRCCGGWWFWWLRSYGSGNRCMMGMKSKSTCQATGIGEIKRGSACFVFVATQRCCVLLQDGKKSANLGNFIIKHAQAKFAEIFGLEMKNVDLFPASGPSGKPKGG